MEIITQFNSEKIFPFTFLIFQDFNFSIKYIEFISIKDKLHVQHPSFIKSICNNLLKLFATNDNILTDSEFSYEKDSVNYAYVFSYREKIFYIHEDLVQSLIILINKVLEGLE